MSLILASYNIHRCYGSDRRYDPDRIRRVLRALDAQVVALQEVELLNEAPELLDFFCEGTGWRAIPGLTLTRENGQYGNALLTSLPVQSMRRINLSYPGVEPRGAMQVLLDHEGVQVRLVATHLGLRAVERRMQLQRVLETIEGADENPGDANATVLMGDLNEWYWRARARRWLQKYFGNEHSPPSYPARFPLFALDRILVRPAECVRRVEVVNNKLTRIASDHLPVVATLDTDALKQV